MNDKSSLVYEVEDILDFKYQRKVIMISLKQLKFILNQFLPIIKLIKLNRSDFF